jgi:RNA polymerase sigma factor (sigma-70 family)
MDALPDHRPESIAYSNELEESIREAFASLTPREAIVLKLRFGLYLDDVIKVLPSGESEALVERMKSDNPARKTYMTLEEIGDIIKVGKERVRGIEGKALRKMRSFSHSDSLLLLYRQESGVRSMLPQSEVEDIPALNSI